MILGLQSLVHGFWITNDRWLGWREGIAGKGVVASMSSQGMASVRQLELPLGYAGDETVAGTGGGDTPVGGSEPTTESAEPPHT